MDAETVYKVAQVLDSTQRERLRQLLNTDTDREPQKPKSKKKKKTMGRKQIKRKNHQRLKKKSKRVQEEKHSPLLLFEINPISSTAQVKPTYKVSAKKRKIYNNTYRLKCKGYRVEPHKHTIYAYNEEVMNTTQAKNLMKLGFVVQLEIQ